MNDLERIHHLPTAYFVTYRFHLVESLRAKAGLPKIIEHTATFYAENVTELAELVSTSLGRCVKSGGVLGDSPLTAKQEHPIILPNVSKDLTNFDLGIFIPGHMIAYIETVTTIKPRQPGADEDDTEVDIQ